MSVPRGQRSKSKLEVQAACEELVRHTVHIMSSERNFDPKYADKRMRRRISRLMALEARGLRPIGTAAEAYVGWRAHAAKGDSRLLIERCDRWHERKRGTYDSC